MIDLHIHSHFSDGEDSYEEILARVKEQEVSIFSITDHNYLHPKVVEYAATAGVRFFQGVEVSSVDRVSGSSLHILGYSKNFDISKLNKSLEPVLEGYNSRAKRILEVLNEKYGSNFDFQKLKDSTPAMFVSRNLIAKNLVAFTQGQLSMKDAVKASFAPEDDAWMPDAVEAIGYIRNAGGKAVLAHPGNLLAKIDVWSLIERLVGAGLEGIEVHYANHTPEMVVTLTGIAQKYGLVMTGGSDWHGPSFSRHPIGVDARVTDFL